MSKKDYSARVAGPVKDTMQCGLSKLLDKIIGLDGTAAYELLDARYTVVQMPDYNGGHYYDLFVGAPIEEDDLNDFEYVEWEGSCYEYMKLMDEGHVFMAHCEPLHEEPEDYPISAQRLFIDYMAVKIDNLYTYRG